jgi:hypothetical protein
MHNISQRGGTHASVNNRGRNSRNRSYDLGGPGFGRLPRWRPEEAEWPVLEGLKVVRGIWLLDAMPAARQQPHGRASRATWAAGATRHRRGRSKRRRRGVGELTSLLSGLIFGSGSAGLRGAFFMAARARSTASRRARWADGTTCRTPVRPARRPVCRCPSEQASQT